MDEALLQKLREASGLRLDREGNFWHQGEPIEHERTLSVLRAGIHRAPDRRWATRIGTEWGYLEVEDAALFVQRLEASGAPGAGLRAVLTSGRVLAVDSGSLALGAGDALYVRVAGERARLTRAAQLALSPALREARGAFELELGGQRLPIGRDSGPEPVRAQ